MKTVAVVVAYNRRELLLEVLKALRAQTLAPDAVVIIDNGSTDGSAAAAMAAFPDVDLLTLARNTGGAGGFAIGGARALIRHDADLVWFMDDDTVPTPGALAALVSAYRRHPAEPSVLASKVVWSDGTDHPMNTPRRKPNVSRSEAAQAALVNAMPVRSASFVSCLVKGSAIRTLGLPVAEYFIWNDDFEFTARLLKDGLGLYVPESVVVHKTAKLTSARSDPGSRFYYEVRNKLWLFRWSSALRKNETATYASLAILRWMFLLLRSDDRKTLLSALRRGWLDGMRTRPRKNADVLANFGEATIHLALVEDAVLPDR
ncbi:glycosyl transferase [Mycetocola zhadangensis]|uniref:glycosyltransferase n=1 Tax=Mycetocola zhadangensis TaxID=1164595 RepID=UPI0019BDFF5B|nr:glycosyltransferase [Mycetocola zhadangensis]GGF00790.1 glycosyl transferase [Mycetocola zhadangensis]